MTDEELIEYYADLLIAQYRSKPKARATVELLAGMFTASQIYKEVQSGFDLDLAVGVQLDTIGKYQDVVRTGYLLDGSFFSLGDGDFRQLIKIAIVINYSEANSYEIKQLLINNFGLSITMFDYGNMRIGYFIDSSIASSELAQLFVKNGLLPKPTGVELSTTLYSNQTDNLYGFHGYLTQSTVNRSPMNDYTNYQYTYAWLTFLSALTTNEELISIQSEDLLDIIIQEDGSELYF